ncbi:hypothetical protein RDI58_016088 [Solanum bulbocastanum]|uniref:DCD domain-containing protein n=1 Tax=Solanum bulbocastanum TaxID=147425 RepID=A0AAN8TFF8_SOLBU
MKKREDAEVKPSSMLDQAFLPIIDSAGVSAFVASPAPASSRDKPRLFQISCFWGWNEKEMVEKIKPGTKLFLFDIELRLLYGVYEVTSTGGIKLEAHVFGGKFPAQIMPALAVEDQVKSLPYPQEVGSSMANVGPLNTNPAFSKEHQDESDRQDDISGLYSCVVEIQGMLVTDSVFLGFLRTNKKG